MMYQTPVSKFGLEILPDPKNSSLFERIQKKKMYKRLNSRREIISNM